MRSGSHTKVREILPVGQVMAALMPRSRPVRDFVVLVPCGLQAFIGVLVHIGAEVFVPWSDAPFVCPGIERRAFFDNQEGTPFYTWTHEGRITPGDEDLWSDAPFVCPGIERRAFFDNQGVE